MFEQNADTSKIYFNVGMIHATLGEHERAVRNEFCLDLESMITSHLLPNGNLPTHLKFWKLKTHVGKLLVGEIWEKKL